MNLAGAYLAVGRQTDAIRLLEDSGPFLDSSAIEMERLALLQLTTAARAENETEIQALTAEGHFSDTQTLAAIRGAQPNLQANVIEHLRTLMTDPSNDS